MDRNGFISEMDLEISARVAWMIDGDKRALVLPQASAWPFPRGFSFLETRPGQDRGIAFWCPVCKLMVSPSSDSVFHCGKRESLPTSFAGRLELPVHILGSGRTYGENSEVATRVGQLPQKQVLQQSTRGDAWEGQSFWTRIRRSLQMFSGVLKSRQD